MTAIEAHSDRYCCCIVNGRGQEILFFRSSEILPCSENLSRAKALTAQHFERDTRAFSTLPEITAAIRDTRYCFLEGGIMFRDEGGDTLFLGLSSDRPANDHQAARDAAKILFTREILS